MFNVRAAGSQSLQGVHSVHHQIEHHLLHLDAVGAYRQDFGRPAGAQRDTSLGCFEGRNIDNLPNQVIQVEHLQGGAIFLFQEVFLAMDDVARALIVPDDVGQDFIHLARGRVKHS